MSVFHGTLSGRPHSFGAFSQVGDFFSNLSHSVQHARMMRVLSAMPDETLHRIGITRQEIPAYAESLIGKDG